MHSLSANYAQSPRLGACGERHVAKVEGTPSLWVHLRPIGVDLSQ